MSEIPSENIRFPNCPKCNMPMSLVRSKINGAEFKCVEHGVSMSVPDAVRAGIKKKIASRLAG